MKNEWQPIETYDNASVYSVTNETSKAVSDIAEKVIDVPAIEEAMKKAFDDVSERLWDKVRDYLLLDTELNSEGHIRYEALKHVRNLLLGKPETMEFFDIALGSPRYSNFIPGLNDSYGIRKKIFAEHADSICNAEIAKLNKEIAELKQQIEGYRNRERERY